MARTYAVQQRLGAQVFFSCRLLQASQSLIAAERSERVDLACHFGEAAQGLLPRFAIGWF
ncbi:hypothetical protein WQ53_10660 [Pseudoxanthomonas suwonensis]|uniref:Uncharacterized protein n=1 Tax=Pseudoxanthomonas suwonensis TaxID=314722 RepID=A0A0E3Z241_9GAMM|nr:hypothetical protein WQ53_10660 [Pseudoxanthomonas suwonensis]